MTHLTSQALLYSNRCYRLGDIVYIPPTHSIDVLLRAIEDLFTKITPDNVFVAFPLQKEAHQAEVSPLTLIPIECEYGWHRNGHNGREPLWIRAAPDPLKAYLRREWVVCSGSYEQFAIVPELSFSSIGYVVLEGGLVQDVVSTFGIERLHYIKQLGYLQDPATTEEGQKALTVGFDHTRYNHSFDVMAVATLLAHNSKLSSADRNTLRTAALTHDALTPAGGDTTKCIDPSAFDEDEHYGELLEQFDWGKIQQKYRVPKQKLIDTVQGKGVLGRLLDLADKISYVSRDAAIYLGRYKPDGPIAYPESYIAIKNLLKQHPCATSVWDAIEVDGEEVLIRDPQRLGVFLKLRALLFRNFYLHQGTRWQEAFLANVVIRYLYETTQVTRESLLRMRDPELDRLLEQKTGIGPFSLHIVFSQDACVESFYSYEAAKRRERELFLESINFTLVEDLSAITKPATHYLVQEKSGALSEFRNAYPELAAEIEEIARLQKPFRLYYLRHDPPFSPEFLDAFRKYLNQRNS